MIKKLQRKIFWLVELLPLSILLLVLISHNVSTISLALQDEYDTLNYCVECVSQYSEQVDEYLKVPVNDLIEIAENDEADNSQIRNLIYALISGDITIVKADSSGEVIAVKGSKKLQERSESSIPKILETERGRTFHSIVHNIVARVAVRDNCSYVIILNTKAWHREVRNTIFTSLLGLLAASILLGLVARKLSLTITRPVEEAMGKQSRFIADASHELKTPISVINANINVLEREYGENKWMRYIKEECTGMNQLISQLLNLCRLDYYMVEENRKQLITEEFEITNVLTQASLPFDSIAFEKGVLIQSDFEETHITRGNRTDFRKIVTILIDNAISHTSKGGTVTISTASHVVSSWNVTKQIYVDVANTGSTISEEDMPYIFERFYKARKDEPQEQNNFGLGLAIAKALADKNGYEMEAFSRDDSAVFRIKLPLIR